MHKIVLFIESNHAAFETPEKIGHLIMNRFAVDEDASFEIFNIHELGKATVKMYWKKHPEYASKGMGLVTRVLLTWSVFYSLL